MGKEEVFDVIKTNLFDERTIISFKSYDEAKKFIDNFCYFGNFTIRKREVCKVWETFEDFVNNTPDAKQKMIKNRLDVLINSSIDIPAHFAILEKVAYQEKINLKLDGNYLRHDSFCIDEIKNILDCINKDNIEQDGKALITYPKTKNYAIVYLNQYNLLEKVLNDRLEEIEKTKKLLEQLTDENDF